MKALKQAALGLIFASIATPALAREYKGPLTPSNYATPAAQEVAKNLNLVYNVAHEAADQAAEGQCSAARGTLRNGLGDGVNIIADGEILADARYTALPMLQRDMLQLRYSSCAATVFGP